ncbi:MAG: hypothetical protein RSE41_03020 [Clostridia bacterium]
MEYTNKYTVFLTPQFLEELAQIYRYLIFTFKIPTTAYKIYDNIKNKTFTLNYSPERYSKIYDKFNNRNFSKNSY